MPVVELLCFSLWYLRFHPDQETLAALKVEKHLRWSISVHQDYSE